ncbi:MAG: polysaccharide pyruvyl transferase family protein [Maricaulaceae bacterium]
MTAAQTAQPHIVLYGLIGVGNYGNDASFEAMLHDLRVRLPNARYTCVSHAPAAVEAEYGVPSESIIQRTPRAKSGNVFVRIVRRLIDEPLSLYRTIKFLNSVDHFVVAGTGFLDDFCMKPFALPLQHLKWAALCKLTRTPYYLACIGAGPIANPITRRFYRWIAKLDTHTSFRDGYSLEFVKGLGVKTDTDEIVPDIVFDLPLSDELKAASGVKEVKTVGFGVMELCDSADGRFNGEACHPEYVEKVGTFVTELVERGLKVRMLTGDVVDNRVTRDLKALFARRIPDLASNITMHPISTMHGLLDELAQVDVAIGSRYHNVVGAMMLEKPVIALGYSPRFPALMNHYAMGEFCQDVWDFDLDKLRSDFTEISANAAEVSAAIAKRNAENRARIGAHFDELADRFAQGPGRKAPSPAIEGKVSSAQG